MKTPIQLAFAIPLLLSLAACASGDLPDYNVLGSLRVLAMQADKPEVDPSTGPTVILTPVVSDVNLGRTLSYSSVGCVDPGIGYGASPNCVGNPTTVTLASGAIPAFNASTHTSTGAAPTLSVSIPPTILANRSDIDKFNGVAYLVIYTLTATAADGSTSKVVSFKRIIASTRTPKNTNPVLTEVNVGSQTLLSLLPSLTFPPSVAPVLSPVIAAGSTETYSEMTSDKTFNTRTETLTTTWFVSDGTTKFYRTEGADGDTWTLPSAKPTTSAGIPRGVVVVAVTRDGRGGEAFKQVE